MDPSAIEALYRQYGPLVLGRARRLLGNDQAADDALQEVFVRVVRGYDAFRRDASPVTWLYRITTNYCLNLLRDAARRERRFAEGGRDPELGASGAPRPGTQESLPEQRLAVAQIVANVSEDLWEIAVYGYVDCMSHEEIARTMGVSRRTIGNRLKEFQCQAQSLLGLPEEVVA
jgi:RNA polymerase sigma-70 factor (ECF subfamily)